MEGLASPCLFGLFHPAIYLTPQTAGDPTLRRYAFAHEYCHKRQGDPFWSLLRVICLALYWFHPLVWVAAICSREDCERACDARVIRLLGEEERLAYGRTLLQLVRIRQGVWQLGHTATTMIAGKRGLRARIERIAAARKVSIPALLALLLCLSLLARCTFTGRLHLTADEALDALEGSITYESGILTFTLPAGYTEGEDWNILVAGRVTMGDTGGGMSVHLFEEENSQHSWVPGRAYSIDLNETHYLELLLDASLPDGDGTAERSIDLLAIAGGGPIDSAVETNGGADGPEDVTVEGYNTVYITFPAYQDGRTDANAFLYDTTPFTAHLLLPESWEVRLPDTEHRTGGALWTPVEIFDGGEKGRYPRLQPL